MKPVARRLWAAFFLLVVGSTRGAEITPERVAAALPELTRLVEGTLKSTGVPGLAVAIVCRDRVVWLEGFGVREAGQAGEVDADTVFQLASLSKPLSATVLASLVGEGTIDWDDRVIDRDPGFRLADPFVTRELTIRDLLCHRSGLAEHEGDLLEDLGYDRGEVLHRLRFATPGSSFRSKYAYTNFGFTEAGVAGAKAAGLAWEELAEARLFRPLGMTATSYRFADYARAGNRARIHVREGNRWVAKHDRQPDAQAPAGGASSSARDMARWLRLQLGGGTFEGRRVVAAGALAETHRPQIVSHPPDDPGKDRAGFYGLGWNVNVGDDGRVRLGHSGAFDLGAATAVTLLPAEGLGIVVLSNGAPIGVPESIAASFIDLVTKGKVERDWLATFAPIFAAMGASPYDSAEADASAPGPASPALPNEAYVGTYRNDYFGDLVVTERAGALLLQVGKSSPVPLRHRDRDAFAYQPVGESAGGPSRVTFRVGPGRRGDRVVVEDLDLRGQGTFAR